MRSESKPKWFQDDLKTCNGLTKEDWLYLLGGGLAWLSQLRLTCENSLMSPRGLISTRVFFGESAEKRQYDKCWKVLRSCGKLGAPCGSHRISIYNNACGQRNIKFQARGRTSHISMRNSFQSSIFMFCYLMKNICHVRTTRH